ncbi:SPW repeat domain-containing protein [Paenibacillus aestuarii]|uniref:SPW repeat protein n=1 Tax=Paenibacillus aestuarii TaxID=516965 RepID=A0ABW0KFP6_9BACL|nr:SPW repeat protein [Paenibacillus aestuarii]
MTLKNILSACLGVWFLLTPWMFAFTNESNAFWLCVILGGLQVICSLLALGKSGRNVWQNWVCFFIGAVFIVIPNLFHWGLLAFFLFVALGFLTMLLNYSNLYAE